MKFIYIAFLSLFLTANVKGQNVYIPDPNFAAFLSTNYPSAMIASDSLNPNASVVLSTTSLEVSGLGINNLTGVEAFVNLNTFKCGNNNLTSLPALPLNLQYLDCSQNHLSSLPSVPSLINFLDCSANQLTSLPVLPSSLTILYCGVNQLLILPALPSSLILLSCHQNRLNSLPTLPTTLQFLTFSNNNVIFPTLPLNLLSLACSNTSLTSLPTLPSNLTDLFCDGNALSSLPTLPSTLHILQCSDNQLTSLSTLPSSLINLICYQNQFTGLPTLPTSLKYLQCQFNQLTSLPAFPSSLLDIYCHNNQLTSLPSLPISLQNLSSYNNLLACLPILPSSLQNLYADQTSCISNLPLNCINRYHTPFCSVTSGCLQSSFVKGNVFDDPNQNGIKDFGEASFSNINVFSSTGNFGAPSDPNGNYLLSADTGVSFTVTASVPLYRTLTTTSGTHNFTSYGVTDSLEDVGIYTTPNINDLEISQTTYGVIRPFGRYLTKLRCFNAGTTVQSGHVYFVKPAVVLFNNFGQPPSSISGDTLFWNFSSLQPLDYMDFIFLLDVPITVPLGTVLNESAAAIGFPNDTTPLNNFLSITLNVVNSLDPNEKTAEPSVLTPAQVANRDQITYTVYFQNTGTAPALNIRVEDTLSNNLDLTTFKMESQSHNITTWYINHRVLVVNFNNINLPDSNANEPDSHGFFKYSVKPVATLQVGDQIDNTAYIYFDYNSPIVTNTTHTSVFTSVQIASSLSNGELNVYPNPANDILHVEFQNATEVSITNLLGQEIIKHKIVTSQKNISIKVNDLSLGIYLVRVKTNKGTSVSKFIRQN